MAPGVTRSTRFRRMRRGQRRDSHVGVRTHPETRSLRPRRVVLRRPWVLQGVSRLRTPREPGQEAAPLAVGREEEAKRRQDDHQPWAQIWPLAFKARSEEPSP